MNTLILIQDDAKKLIEDALNTGYLKVDGGVIVNKVKASSGKAHTENEYILTVEFEFKKLD